MVADAGLHHRRRRARRQSTFKLAAGAYRAVLETQDRFGKKVTALLPLQVLEPGGQDAADQGPERGGRAEVDARAGRGVHGPLGHRLRQGPGVRRNRAPPQDRPELLDRSRARRSRPVKQAVTEAMRGGFTLRVTMVRENRAYLTAAQGRRAVDQQEADA